MEIKLKLKDGKETVTVLNEVQAAAFLKAGFVPATKSDADALKEETPKEEVVE